MAYEMREGSGSLFKNKHKQPGEKTPDRKGDFLLGGVVYEIAGWIKTPKNGGDEFLSFTVKPKDGHNHSRPGGHATARPDAQPGDDQRLPDDNVPF